MDTKLIRLEDGTLVEVYASPNEEVLMSGSAAEKVKAAMHKILPVLKTVCQPISDAWQELNKDLIVDHAEVEIGLSFEGEGNLYITKAKAGANLTLKLLLKPKT